MARPDPRRELTDELAHFIGIFAGIVAFFACAAVIGAGIALFTL